MIAHSSLISGINASSTQAARSVSNERSTATRIGSFDQDVTPLIHVFHGDAGTPGVEANYDVISQSHSDRFNELHAKAESLQASLDGPYHHHDAADKRNQLDAVNLELEQLSLTVLEEHLLETATDDDKFVSKDELYDLANDGTATDEVQQAAQFFIDNNDLLRKLDVADDHRWFSRVDDKVSLGDIQARQRDVNGNFDTVDEPKLQGDGRYELPDGTAGNITTSLEAPRRDQAFLDAQQDAIEESIRTGESVEFLNSNGEIIQVRVELDSTGVSSKYKVHVDGHSFELESEIGQVDTIAGVADIVEFGSTMGVPEGIRQYPDSVLFDRDAHKDNWRASYGENHRMTFFEGTDYLQSRERYHHEIAHGIGRDLHDDKEVSKVDDEDIRESSPEDWHAIDDEIGKNNGHVSGYADFNESEGFAEAFAAYMNAKEHGPEALEEFREAYKLQADYIDEYVFGIEVVMLS